MLSEKNYLEIAETYGTPSFVYDLHEADNQYHKIRSAVPDNVGLCFAIKANSFLSSFFASRLQLVEACSYGEFEICEKQKISPDKILYSGVNKTQKEVEDAIHCGVKLLTIESLKHASIIELAAERENKTVCAIVRLSSGGQFGIDRNTVIDLYNCRNKYPHIDMIGIHYFTGTQKHKASEIQRELKKIYELCIEIEEKTGASIKHIEYGPGIGVSYFENDKMSDFDGVELLRSLRDDFSLITNKYSLTLEMGRLFCASCGSYITEVNDVKTNDGINYCILNGGINNINYFGQMMGMKQPSVIHLPETSEGISKYTVCGSLCTFQDIVIREYETHKISIGDIFVFKKIGAYSSTEGINLFLSRDLPSVLTVDENTVHVLRPNTKTSSLNG